MRGTASGTGGSRYVERRGVWARKPVRGFTGGGAGQGTHTHLEGTRSCYYSFEICFGDGFWVPGLTLFSSAFRLRQEFECQSGDVIVLGCDGVFDVLSSSKAHSLSLCQLRSLAVSPSQPFQAASSLSSRKQDQLCSYVQFKAPLGSPLQVGEQRTPRDRRSHRCSEIHCQGGFVGSKAVSWQDLRAISATEHRHTIES